MSINREQNKKQLRMFLGIPIADDLGFAMREQILVQAPELEKKERWVKSGNFHVTIRFIGNVAASEVPILTKTITEKINQLEKFSILISGIAAFPAKNSRIIAAQVILSDKLAWLIDAIEMSVQICGFKPELRRPRPHITLCRLKKPLHHHFKPIIWQQEVLATEMILYHSQPTEEGSVYCPQHHYKFI